MSLSPRMSAWVASRIREAHEILKSEKSTDSQRAVARMVLCQWLE